MLRDMKNVCYLYIIFIAHSKAGMRIFLQCFCVFLYIVHIYRFLLVLIIKVLNIINRSFAYCSFYIIVNTSPLLYKILKSKYI